LKSLLSEAGNALETAVRLSIAGNIIDAGPNRGFDLRATVERVLSEPFGIEDLEALRDALSRASRVLYLADNAGETVFDRLMIETIGVPVLYAVKGGPVLNDATLEDALEAGIEGAAHIISTGSNAPGTVLEQCSMEFREVYEGAELIIAKGQANYETLSGEGPKLFFLLQAKCPVIAAHLRVPVGSIVLKRGENA
jgi:uncharacterized protein with ATP-grasp and redox domains